jgi:hypothetical protein
MRLVLMMNRKDFLFWHKNHSNSALENEIPVCVFLKRQGYGVILIEEIKGQLSADIEIDGRLFEIKRISNAKNIRNAVKFQFRTTYAKSGNLILWVDIKYNFESLKSAIIQSAKEYHRIKCLWLVYGNTFSQLNRKEMLNGDL